VIPEPRPPTSALDETLQTLVDRLLGQRNAAGHWEGRLASSALATATAVSALALADPGSARHQGLIRQGLDWLAGHRNEDGGWGDTVLSPSNVSATSVCWAAFAIAGGAASHEAVVSDGASWLRRAAGGLEAERLAAAIVRRYGDDRTFSTPILTALALGSRLGPEERAWSHVPQLPFELAACPHSWFRSLRLPVVSYALPALIALGQARHHRRPTRNPLARLLRSWTGEPTLRLLERIQPSSGGFLEAVPLTSFVVMSLLAAERRGHPAVERGVCFLLRSVRPDGSWPIDTNLATWVTTLSVNALWLLPDFDARCPSAEGGAIREWLLGQQLQHQHPYTHAAPGGWAWTDLPGGVPDADDTAGALLALRKLRLSPESAQRAVAAGVRWLLDLQNRDGGIPTFCRGWGRLEFDRSSPDLTAHALLAWDAWRDELPRELRERVARASRKALLFLRSTQRQDGAWAPLWFGNERAPEEASFTYGTGRVLIALAAGLPASMPETALLGARATAFLLEAQNGDGGWGGAQGVASSIEETAIAVDALAAQAAGRPDRDLEHSLSRGALWLIEASDHGRRTDPSPIGLYFARLWYFEELYPLVFSVSALARTRSRYACWWTREPPSPSSRAPSREPSA
jgi:squalene-hopene/tetraprenyl-beta-curcumene cyclase